MPEKAAERDYERSWKLALRAAVRFALFTLIFVSAGALGWTRAWVFFGLMLLIMTINLTVILCRNPGLLRERLKKDMAPKRFDRVFMWLALPLSVAVFIVAGLDAVRFAWSSVSVQWLCVGVALHLVGDVPVAWAMATNPHLERTIRIQDERGHRVITSGPYRFVRHPMYVGILVMLVGWPLVLGSLWAYTPVGLLALLLVLRTALEDRTLRKELPGYEEYAQRTRYRLVPGVW